MADLYIRLAQIIVPFIIGIVVGILIYRVPRRGWIGLTLLLLAGFFWAMTEPSDPSAAERLWTMPCFTFLAPIAVIYCFRSRKHSPDRLLANAAFIGSFVIVAALLFMLCGAAYVAYAAITHHL